MRALPVLLLWLTACPDEEPVWEKSGCDPLDPTLCALPFPSDYFTVAAPTATGVQVAYTTESFPENNDDTPITPTAWNRRDGFSPGTPMLAYFDDVSLDGVITLDHLEDYTATDVKTVVVNTVTGERVPHFVELDASAPSPDEALLMIRPVVPLEWGTRYVVGLRRLDTNAGGPVASSPAFLALRDGTPTEDGDVEIRREHFDAAVFPVLTATGFARDEIQLAWDFTTASRESTLGDLYWVRDDALSFIEEEGIDYRIDSVEDHDCDTADIGRTVEGTILGFPLYLTEDRPARGLARDASGHPIQNGTKDVDFLVRIPCSITLDPQPSMLLQYGHGFFGDKSEARTGWLSRFVDERRYVVLATDWTGMSEDDAPWIGLLLSDDPSEFPVLPEGTFQGFVEAMAALRLARGALATDPAVTFSTDAGDVSVIDPARFAYYGISQGGILGGPYVGMSPDLERGAFGVSGGPYSFLTHRSVNFKPFFSIFKEKYSDHREIALLIGGLQSIWDPGDPMGLWSDMNRDVPDGQPSKDILMQVAIGDAQVTTYGAQIQARMYQSSTVAPQTRPVFGIEERDAPFTGSAYVEWEYSDVPAVPLENLPPNEDFDPHECPRRSPLAQEQVAHFLETGEVIQPCDGRCVDVRSERCP
jgi:hypothetical protein